MVFESKLPNKIIFYSLITTIDIVLAQLCVGFPILIPLYIIYRVLIEIIDYSGVEAMVIELKNRLNRRLL